MPICSARLFSGIEIQSSHKFNQGPMLRMFASVPHPTFSRIISARTRMANPMYTVIVPILIPKISASAISSTSHVLVPRSARINNASAKPYNKKPI